MLLRRLPVGFHAALAALADDNDDEAAQWAAYRANQQAAAASVTAAQAKAQAQSAAASAAAAAAAAADVQRLVDDPGLEPGDIQRYASRTVTNSAKVDVAVAQAQQAVAMATANVAALPPAQQAAAAVDLQKAQAAIDAAKATQVQSAPAVTAAQVIATSPAVPPGVAQQPSLPTVSVPVQQAVVPTQATANALVAATTPAQADATTQPVTVQQIAPLPAPGPQAASLFGSVLALAKAHPFVAGSALLGALLLFRRRR